MGAGVSGYQTSDEMSGVAGKVSGEIGPIGDEADAIGRSQVGASDGGRDFGDKATAYATALHDNVIASIRAYATATTTVSDKLTDTYRQYAGAEGHNAGRITTSGANA
jgi:hypothetical protein